MLNNCIAPCGHNWILQLQKRTVYLPRFHRLGKPGTPLQRRRSISTCCHQQCTVPHGWVPTSQDESGMHPTKPPNTKSAAGSLPSPLYFKRNTDASWNRSSLASAGLAMIIRDSHSFFRGGFAMAITSYSLWNGNVGSRDHHYPLFLSPWNTHSFRISHYS